MDDLISRQALLEEYDRLHVGEPGRARKMIEDAPAVQSERKSGRWIETEGLDEEIRCIMCSNPMKTNRGCDGLCRYNEHLYHEIISVLENRITKVE